MDEIIINPALFGKGSYLNEFLEAKTVFFSYVYLHGELEEKVQEIGGYDVCGIVGNPNAVQEGIHPCQVLGIDEPCKLFIWYAEVLKKMKGLIVLESDKESYEYAMKCFMEQSVSL